MAKSNHKPIDISANVLLDNPLGVVYVVPKSEPNLRSSTIFGDEKSEGNDADGKRKMLSSNGLYSHLPFA